jgi:6-phosphogluconolactonase
VTPGPSIVLSEDPGLVAATTAARLAARILTAVETRGGAHVVLTGGGVGTATLAALAVSEDVDRIDWARVDLWWGDERFLPRGDPDRNETQAGTALLDALPIPAERVHPMPAAGDGPWGQDPDAAAAVYAAALAEAWRTCEAAGDDDVPVAVPAFDVVLLGVGPDGHIASLFPEHPDQRSGPGVTVVGVRNSPKPPPTRISLTFGALCRAREVWLLAAGAEKAQAVRRALSGADRQIIPAAGVTGTEATVWMVDRASAALIPERLLSR